MALEGAIRFGGVEHPTTTPKPPSQMARGKREPPHGFGLVVTAGPTGSEPLRLVHVPRVAPAGELAGALHAQSWGTLWGRYGDSIPLRFVVTPHSLRSFVVPLLNFLACSKSVPPQRDLRPGLGVCTRWPVSSPCGHLSPAGGPSRVRARGGVFFRQTRHRSCPPACSRPP